MIPLEGIYAPCSVDRYRRLNVPARTRGVRLRTGIGVLASLVVAGSVVFFLAGVSR